MEKVMIKNSMRVTTYSIGSRKFEIVMSEVPDMEKAQYFAIDHKYIDKNWRLTKELNGLEMCMSDSVEDCIKWVTHNVEVENFAKKHRCSRMVASMVMNGMTMKQAKKVEKDILGLTH